MEHCIIHCTFTYTRCGNRFSETAVGCTASYFVKIVMFPSVMYPLHYFEDVYRFICGRRRFAVARYRMICLVLEKGVGWGQNNKRRSPCIGSRPCIFQAESQLHLYTTSCVSSVCKVPEQYKIHRWYIMLLMNYKSLRL